MPFEREPDFVVHRAEPEGDRGKRWLFFVDPAGVIRHAGSFAVLSTRLDPGLELWIDALRDFQEPERELPEISRKSAK